MTDTIYILFRLIVRTSSFMLLEVIKDNIFLIASLVTREELD